MGSRRRNVCAFTSAPCFERKGGYAAVIGPGFPGCRNVDFRLVRPSWSAFLVGAAASAPRAQALSVVLNARLGGHGSRGISTSFGEGTVQNIQLGKRFRGTSRDFFLFVCFLHIFLVLLLIWQMPKNYLWEFLIQKFHPWFCKWQSDLSVVAMSGGKTCWKNFLKDRPLCHRYSMKQCVINLCFYYIMWKQKRKKIALLAVEKIGRTSGCHWHMGLLDVDGILLLMYFRSRVVRLFSWGRRSGKMMIGFVQSPHFWHPLPLQYAKHSGFILITAHEIQIYN